MTKVKSYYAPYEPTKLLCGHYDCQYSAPFIGSRMCDYLNIVGHKRDCKPTWNCKHYKRGRIVKDVNQITLLSDG